jgi:hypothetical protein
VPTSEPAPGGQQKAKRKNQPRLGQGNDPVAKKARAKAKKNARIPRIQSGPAFTRATRNKVTTGPESWIRPDRLNGASSRTSGVSLNSPLTQSGWTGSRVARTESTPADVSLTHPDSSAIRTVGTKSKSASAKSKRNTRTARRGGKISAFSSPSLPADAALN